MSSIHLQFQVPQPLPMVHLCLSDMRRFAEVHPVMERALPLGPDRFRMIERLPLLFLKVRFSYPAVVKSTSDPPTVTMDATVMRLARIHLAFRLFPEGNGTRVEEHATISSPLPVHRAMRKAFQKYHPLLFEAIGRQAAHTS